MSPSPRFSGIPHFIDVRGSKLDKNKKQDNVFEESAPKNKYFAHAIHPLIQ